MPITVYTEQQIFDAVVGYFRAQFALKDLGEYSFLGKVARASAQALLLLQADVDAADGDACPAYQTEDDGTIRSRASSAALDRWAFVFGLPSDVAGIYGRRGAVAAAGGIGDPTGLAGTTYAAGAQATDPTGQVVVALQDAFVVGTTAAGSSRYAAVTKGAAGNLTAGTILSWVSPPVGGGLTVTLSSGLSGGLDRESDASLLTRILYRLQNPPKGGTVGDYHEWALTAIDAVGQSIPLAECYVYPHRDGLGTVTAVVTQSGTGLGRKPGAAVISATQAWLNLKRPVTATVYVLAPYMHVGVQVGLYARVQPKPKFGFDWDDGAGIFTISAATPTTVTFPGTSAALMGAIDALKRPRVQINNFAATATALPYQRRAVSYDLVTVPGSTVLTLDAAISPVPAVNSLLRAGGGCVEGVAQALLDHVDQAGPSRASGYADTLTTWRDRITIAGLAQAALNSFASDGTKYLDLIPGITTPSVEINATGNDFVTFDNSPNGPEMAYVGPGGIAVVKQI